MAEDKKKSGGSVTLERRGLVRGGGENATAPTSDRLCVIGGTLPGDMSETEARRLYFGDARAQEVITAILDVIRASEPCPPYFWHSCRAGVDQAVRYVDLGAANDGVTYLFIVDGRHRKSAAYEVTREREEQGSTLGPCSLPTLVVQIPADPMAAAKIVRELKNKANIRVPMRPTSLAARALEFLPGSSVYAVGVTIGLRHEVAEKDATALLSLALCVPEIGAAVDAGEVPIEAIAKWRDLDTGEMTKTPEAQRAWLAKRLAPKPERKPRASKPMARKLLARFLGEILPEGIPSDTDLAAFEAVCIATGAITPDKITTPSLRAAYLRATERGK